MSITKEELEQLIENSVQKIFGKVPNQNFTSEKYLDIEEAASLLKLAPQTIYGLTSKRLIPFVKKRHKIIFIKSDLEQWVMEGKKITVQEIYKRV